MVIRASDAILRKRMYTWNTKFLILIKNAKATWRRSHRVINTKSRPFPGMTKNVTALQRTAPRRPNHFFVFKHTKSQPLQSQRVRYKILHCPHVLNLTETNNKRHTICNSKTHTKIMLPLNS